MPKEKRQKRGYKQKKKSTPPPTPLPTVHQTFGWWKHGGLGVAEHTTKGRYLFATRPVRAGQLILTEQPIFTGKNHEEVAEQMVGDPRFLHLYPPVPPSPGAMDVEHALKVVASNSWGIKVYKPDRQRATAIYLHMSMINHSCVPNSCFMKNSLYALRNIKVGEEVTCSYLLPPKLGDLSAEERSRRMSTWFPQCRCTACLVGTKYSVEEMEKLHDWPKGKTPSSREDGNVEFWGARAF